ncbi:hypothetical protein GH714_012110 [Hevea brasiliensis]|uniref:Flavin-containing monooxygenase n=1 Tax=Hevea brasiliensis TaxID=3981 RepID=A0A6A6MUB1_HEVBR|nr:hypothetical protein GH714_012110 [Hevea brasiliensis]
MENRVAIIGAGVSGLLACKCTLNKGLTQQFLKLKKELEEFGHVLLTQPGSKTPNKVISIDYVGESFQEMESWDLWGGTGKPFGSKGKWHIKVQHTKTCSIEEYHAEFVILCIGQFSGVPNIPEFSPDEGPQVFKGKVMHSGDFSALDNLGTEKFIQGKRVAVIGSHKSAADTATECANTNGVNFPCTMVQRNAQWFLPGGSFSVFLLGFLYLNRFSELLVHKPGETFLFSFLVTLLSPLRWGISKFMESYLKWTLPLKKYGMLPKFSFDEHMSSCQIAMLPENFFDKVEEGSIIIKNSQSFRFCREGLIIEGEAQPLETDIVIFATGFKGYEKLANIFESSVFQDCLKATAPLLLYRQILHPRIPQLAIIGYNESFSTLGNSELKSLWLANFLDGNLELPCVKSMEKEAKMWGDHIKQDLGTEKRQTLEDDPFACPICYEPLIRKGPPGFNLSAIYRSGFKCKKCNKTYSSKDNYLDLTITAAMKEYNEVKPARTELFRSPLVSFLYERGWRQNFNQSGFPGPDEEFKMAQEYFKPAEGGLLVDVSCGSGLFSRKFAKSGTYSKVVALDFSENMLRQCYDFIKQDITILNTNLALVRADVSRLPFSSGSVDAVHAGAALHCWPSPSNAVKSGLLDQKMEDRQTGKMLQSIQALKTSIHISEDSWSSGNELGLTIQEKTEDFDAKKETILLDDTTILLDDGDKKLMDEKLKDENLAGKTLKADVEEEATFY